MTYHPRFSRCLIVLLITGLVADAEEDATKKPQKLDQRAEFKKSLAKNCAGSYSMTCLKLDIVSWVDRLSDRGDYDILPGVSVVRENGSARANTADLVTEVAREFPNDADARLNAYLLKKIEG